MVGLDPIARSLTGTARPRKRPKSFLQTNAFSVTFDTFGAVPKGGPASPRLFIDLGAAA